MRTVRRIGMASVALVTGLALAAAPAAAAPTTSPPRPELQKALDALGDAGLSGTLARVRDEKGRWAGVSGVGDLRTGEPVPVNGRFRVGSITKTFVATVLLQLESERRLDLDDSVERHLPGLVPNGKNISIRQLLNHTSGIYNYTDAMPLDGEEFLKIRFKYYSPRDLVKIATAHAPDFPPGQGWNYSNTNYILAGMVVEKVTGRSYGSEIQRRIIRPLGLRHTSIPGRSTAVPGPHSHGYLLIGERTVDVTRLGPSWAWAAGEIISTTADLNRFYAALLGGKVLRPSQLAAMKTTVPVGEGFGYGLGLIGGDLPCGGKAWGHSGGIHGYITESLHTEDGRAQLSVSMNPLTGEGMDEALNNLIVTSLCGSAPVSAAKASTFRVPAIVR